MQYSFTILKVINCTRPFLGQFAKPLMFGFGYFCYLHNKKSIYTHLPYQKSSIVPKKQPSPAINYNTVGKRIYYLLWQAIRFIHLLAIFSPAILLLPLSFSRRTQDIWLRVFVKCIENAGVVWIKTFQYLSHRRDMIGEKMAERFIHLRQAAPQHPFTETKKAFRKEFGKDIKQIFQYFNQIPIASGSVSQVYQAHYKGQKVAVKVRHPGVEKYIEKDLDLLFMISKVLSFFSGKFEIPVGEESLKSTLTEQIDFRTEAKNLHIFNEMFIDNEQAHFPKAIDEVSRASILVQQFIEGIPITYYESHQHFLNKIIARIGASAFFQMLMKHNFVHADCHGGNILVTIKDRKVGFKDQISDAIYWVFRAVQNKLVQSNIISSIQMKLYLESRKQDDEVRRLERLHKKKVDVTLIDAGMVITLDETDRLNFVKFLQSFISKEYQECAQLVYSLSMYKGKKIIEELDNSKYQHYYNDLKILFSSVNKQNLGQMNGMDLFKEMLDLIRKNSMKLDGQFATLLTNILVLEAISRHLSPQLQILKCAVPYFHKI